MNVVPLSRLEFLARVRSRLGAPQKPWSIRNADGADGKPAELRLYDEIGFFGIDSDAFARELDEVTADELVVAINSPGGDVFDSIAIFNVLRQHPARITTRVDSLAASGASIVFQAGDRRIMVSGSQQMIHEAWGIGMGRAEDLRDLAKLLDRQTEVIAGIYAERTGRPRVAIRKLLADETWFTAEEAVKEKFADEIVKPGSRPKSSLTADQQKVLGAAEQHVRRFELEQIATKVALEAQRERFLQALITDSRPKVGYVEAKPPAFASQALSAVRAAAADLGISTPPVRWFRRANNNETPTFTATPVEGKASKGVVWLSAEISPLRVVTVAAHETAHVAGLDEIDAQIYGDRYTLEVSR